MEKVNSVLSQLQNQSKKEIFKVIDSWPKNRPGVMQSTWRKNNLKRDEENSKKRFHVVLGEKSVTSFLFNTQFDTMVEAEAFVSGANMARMESH